MRSKTPFRAKLLLAVISILVLLASIAMVWNTARLQKEVSIRTQQYVSDVTVQLAKDIDHRLSKNIEDLESICDSLLRIDPEESETLDEFLKRKARTFGYSAIVATDTAGGVYQVGTPLISDVFSLAGMQASRAGQSSVSFLDAQQILYSIPIRQNGEIRGVLGGVRDKENMQALIQAESFSGKSLTCIVARSLFPRSISRRLCSWTACLIRTRTVRLHSGSTA